MTPSPETSSTDSAPRSDNDAAHGYGLATISSSGTVLDVWYPQPQLGLGPQTLGQASPEHADLSAAAGDDPARGVTQQVVFSQIKLSEPPADTADAYLRLHLLSHRLVKPNSINLVGVFAQLPNVVWTNFGPCEVANFEATRLRLRARGAVHVYGIDKFPALTDYVVPTGVRIADSSRVRLGAYLAEGTTVMHEGFVNFNAGTLGASMVEGRISAGVVVGDGSDIGGGASIMGTLSGGGQHRTTVGEHTLLGANSGIGISLGDHCVVEAGLYVTAGTVVTLLSAKRAGGERTSRIVKALELSGQSNLLFRRNSVTGAVEALPRADHTVELNEELHKN